MCDVSIEAGQQNEQVVAIVVLRSASGESITAGEPITTETLSKYQPADEDVTSVEDYFAEAGFDVGVMVGISLSLTGSRQKFEALFDTHITRSDDGAWIVKEDAEEPSQALPLGALTETISQKLEAVVFDTPMTLHDAGKTSVDF